MGVIVVSIAIGVLVAWLLYRVLFYDFADLRDGCVKFFTFFLRGKRRGLFSRQIKPPTPEDFEDESWFSGVRFFLLLAFSIGSACLTYSGLHRHFG